MYSLYLNITPVNGQKLGSLNNNAICKTIRTKQGQLSCFYDSREWLSVPYIIEDNFILVISGWFIMDGEKNNIQKLASLFKSEGLDAINNIDEGVYHIYLELNGEFYYFHDKLAIQSAYYTIKNDKILISPSLSEFKDKEIDEEFNSLLMCGKNLFGKYTIYKSIYRFKPMKVFDLKNKTFLKAYKHVCKDIIALDDLPEYMKLIASNWRSKEKIVGLSSGLDSRLAALTVEAAETYTWGPENAKDRKVAKLISDSIGSIHTEFSFIKKYDEQDTLLHDYYISNSSVQTKGIIPSINFIGSKCNARVTFDGYLGDTLKRKTYHFNKGAKYEAFKFLPFIVKKLDPEKVLLEKYDLNEADRLGTLLLNEYRDFIKVFHLSSDINAVAIFEILQGRGARRISAGGILVNSYWFTVVPLFMLNGVFGSIIKSTEWESSSKNSVMTKMWSRLRNNDSAHHNTEGLYNPFTKKYFIPIRELIGRALTNYVSKFSNYTNTK